MFEIQETKQPRILEVREAVASQDRLSSNASNSHHGEATIHEFAVHLLLHGGLILGSSKIPGKVCLVRKGRDEQLVL